MAATKEGITFRLKFLIDRDRNKVVFAEAENDFVDILFSFLTLPMGTIIRILNSHSDMESKSIGSFTTLYKGVENLDAKHFSSEERKTMLLNPKNAAEAYCCHLKLNIDNTGPTKYFRCPFGCYKGNKAYLSTYYNDACRKCVASTTIEVILDSNVSSHVKDGAFVVETASFVITDDLSVIPNLVDTSLTLLKDLKIRDTGVLEETSVDIGFKEILNLLKLSLLSKCPLTDLLFCENNMVSDIVKLENINPSQPETGKETTSADSASMSLKIMVQKSENKLLFAQTEENFVEYLFSMLTIPLGSVISMLGGNTSAGIGNLYKSVSLLTVGRYIKSQELKKMLQSPQLAPLHLCKNNIFSLHEAQYYLDNSKSHMTLQEKGVQVIVQNCKIRPEFTRGPATFMVTDDLLVTQLSSISVISVLKKLKIPLDDVEERVVNISLEEALKIMKAALESNSSLSNGLNIFPKKVNRKIQISSSTSGFR